MPGMLYYPHINAPRHIIAQALLYWDSISTITPPLPDSHFTPEMRELRNLGFFKPIEGIGLYNEAEADSILSDLKVALRSFPLDDLIPPLSTVKGVDDSRGLRVIHFAKLHPSIPEELIHKGLAEVLEGTRSRAKTLRVSSALQLVLLSISARTCASAVNRSSGCTALNSLRPFTDELFAFNGYRAGVDSYYEDYAPGSSLCWEVEVGGLLPIPRNEVSIDSLLEFRQKYDAERRRLVLAVELLLHGLQQQFNHPADVLKALTREITEAVNDLQSAARSRRIGLARRSLAACISLGAAGTALHMPTEAWILGVIGGAAINIATNVISGSVEEGPRRDFGYLLRIYKALAD